MRDVLIAWVADGDGDRGLHLDYEIWRGDLWGRWSERERITSSRLRAVEVVCMNWGWREVVAESKGLVGGWLASHGNTCTFRHRQIWPCTALSLSGQ